MLCFHRMIPLHLAFISAFLPGGLTKHHPLHLLVAFSSFLTLISLELEVEVVMRDSLVCSVEY